MSIIKRKINFYPEFVTPQTNIVSEGDQLIKDLVEKQLNTNVRLQDTLLKEKKFTSGVELINENQFLAGKTNLKTFQQRNNYLQNLEFLKSCGLSDNEINLYNDYKKGKEFLLSNHKHACPFALTQTIESILDKIEKGQNNSSNLKEDNISRHVKEIALSTKPESIETKLYKFAAGCSSKTTRNLLINDPINSLTKLEKELLVRVNNACSSKKRRKKARKFDLKECLNKETNKKKINAKPVKVYTCEAPNYYTIENNKIVKLNKKSSEKIESKCALKGKPFIAGNNRNERVFTEKLSEEEIKLLPRFKNYEKGIPSQILFVKNLAKTVNEEDLVKLFGAFDTEENKIVYRLLTGKMKGQAFVQFNSVEQATKALEASNGTIVKKTPVIIQYGKRHS